MQKISSIEIKNKFLSFFKNNDHMEISDSSVVPKNDPTLLFINSGMAPLKNFFTGVEKPPYKRLCDIQPCIRTIDIDSIGDKHHLTSFQMLGSWSINDYFKEKAISLAFKFLTEGLNIPKEKLYVTVFAGDEELGLPLDTEAYGFWKKVGMPENHIIKCGKEDNFWGPTAETGPCGPCTEIFYDTGEGEEYLPGKKFDTKKRYIEIWNAGVFMQLNKNADGTFSKLSFTSVDTGAGLERLSMVLNGFSTVYDTDLLNPIKKFIESKIPSDKKLFEKDIRIMTDHLRTASLILSEKVSPSNEGRGYIPRKLIRRCMMIIAKNKIKNFDFSEVIAFVLDKYSDLFPRFSENRNFVINEIKKEQVQFEKILENGLEKLENINNSKKKITAEIAFDLVTTYGLPFDIISSYAEENSLELDAEGFKQKLQSHKEKSKNIAGAKENESLKNLSELLCNCSKTEFVGYENLEFESKVLKIIKNGTEVSIAKESDEVIVILDKTPFYAESGGQCADIGNISNDYFNAEITDVKKICDGIFVHRAKVNSGSLSVNTTVKASVNKSYRKEISNNHTAVHLLQSALRQLFGKNVHQAGSKVESKKLRFDFNYDNSISEEDIFKIENIVNSYIRENIPGNVEIKNISDAIAGGATALFESKYGENVRVVTYGNVSSELCGGTHTNATGNIGTFVICSSESIGKGIKRITAITGQEALTYIQHKQQQLAEISKILKSKPENVVEKIKKLTENKPQKDIVRNSIKAEDLKLVNSGFDCKFGYITVDEFDKKVIGEISKIAEKIEGIAVCVSKDGKIVVAVSDKCSANHFANDILKNILDNFGGKGGGNKKVATGSAGKDFGAIIEYIEKIR